MLHQQTVGEDNESWQAEPRQGGGGGGGGGDQRRLTDADITVGQAKHIRDCLLICIGQFALADYCRMIKTGQRCSGGGGVEEGGLGAIDLRTRTLW